jgi:hypothetical protein
MKNLVGIKQNPDDSDASTVFIEPRFAKRLTFAEGSICVPAGKVWVRWDRTETGATVRCNVPKGACATLCPDDGYRFENGASGVSLPIGESLHKLIKI